MVNKMLYQVHYHRVGILAATIIFVPGCQAGTIKYTSIFTPPVPSASVNTATELPLYLFTTKDSRTIQEIAVNTKHGGTD